MHLCIFTYFKKEEQKNFQNISLVHFLFILKLFFKVIAILPKFVDTNGGLHILISPGPPQL
jgi:hypothetical protein